MNEFTPAADEALIPGKMILRPTFFQSYIRNHLYRILLHIYLLFTITDNTMYDIIFALE
jgi:hypothetical protein